MGHTNSTANLSLPQFIGTDKPTWLGDVNGAFSAIDAYAGTNDAAVAAAVSDASSAVSQAAAAVNTANTANTTAGNASTAANNAIGVANTANAIAGTVDTKVGLLADLHTTDRTSIVNAINEVKDAEGDLTTLTTTDKTSLVNAINEVAGGGLSIIKSVTADGVKTYSDILDEFWSEHTNVKANSMFSLIDSGNSERVASLSVISASTIDFEHVFLRTGGYGGYSFQLRSSGSSVAYGNNSTITDISSTVPTAGVVFNLYA